MNKPCTKYFACTQSAAHRTLSALAICFPIHISAHRVRPARRALPVLPRTLPENRTPLIIITSHGTSVARTCPLKTHMGSSGLRPVPLPAVVVQASAAIYPVIRDLTPQAAPAPSVCSPCSSLTPRVHEIMVTVDKGGYQKYEGLTHLTSTE
jgi:hypothetical protein